VVAGKYNPPIGKPKRLPRPVELRSSESAGYSSAQAGSLRHMAGKSQMIGPEKEEGRALASQASARLT